MVFFINGRIISLSVLIDTVWVILNIHIFVWTALLLVFTIFVLCNVCMYGKKGHVLDYWYRSHVYHM